MNRKSFVQTSKKIFEKIGNEAMKAKTLNSQIFPYMNFIENHPLVTNEKNQFVIGKIMFEIKRIRS